ncbi:MAG: hypothetical protein K2X03_04855 [Bryobacteraceae bacterium]|nr:hypothetical protein [Bryobacteraceae bacterium]
MILADANRSLSFGDSLDRYDDMLRALHRYVPPSAWPQPRELPFTIRRSWFAWLPAAGIALGASGFLLPAGTLPDVAWLSGFALMLTSILFRRGQWFAYSIRFEADQIVVHKLWGQSRRFAWREFRYGRLHSSEVRRIQYRWLELNFAGQRRIRINGWQFSPPRALVLESLAPRYPALRTRA